jgi:hypothetical protein
MEQAGYFERAKPVAFLRIPLIADKELREIFRSQHHMDETYFLEDIGNRG